MSAVLTGSLFSGYLGLDLAVRDVFPDSQTAFVADIDPGACKVLAHRAPEAPNLGDVSKVDWSPWAGRISILTAGFPCQDVSAAGKRAGLKEGTRTGLWHQTARAIDELRPGLVLLENVRGLLSARGDDPTAEHLAAEATAHAAKRLTEWLDNRHALAVRQGRTEHARDIAARRLRAMGCRKRALDRARRHERRLVRALGTVLGSLADIGYDAAWCGLRAADVGAAHGRWRVFILAWPADAEGFTGRGGDRDRGAAAIAERGRPGRRAAQLSGSSDDAAGDGAGTALLPSPGAYDGERGGAQHPDKRLAGGHSVTLQDAVQALLPTPKIGGQGDNASERRRKTPNLEATLNMLPTPRATDGTNGGPNQRGSSGDLMLPSAVAALLPTPTVQDGANTAGPSQFDRNSLPLNAAVTLLPTPAVNDMGAAYTPDEWDAWTDRMKAEHGNGNGHGASLSIEAMRLLPTPMGGDAKAARNSTAIRHKKPPTGVHAGDTLIDVAHASMWGKYADAIRRWEQVNGPAPEPTETGPKGNPRLSCRFDEWLMGLTPGWITDVPEVTHNEALKLCGNGVVWQQGAEALRWLLAVRAQALAVAA